MSLQSFDEIPQQDEATQKKIQDIKDQANAIKTDDELETQMPKLLEMIDSMVDQFKDEDGEDGEVPAGFALVLLVFSAGGVLLCLVVAAKLLCSVVSKCTNLNLEGCERVQMYEDGEYDDEEHDGDYEEGDEDGAESEGEGEPEGEAETPAAETAAETKAEL